LDPSPQSLVERARGVTGMIGCDLASSVTCTVPYSWTREVASGDAPVFKVVAYDYGIKWNILNSLARAGCAVTVVPAFTSAEDVLGMNPDGIFLSNGPGDPEPVEYAVESS
jgi:carbamoyl-phosphate synthase small subunit